MSGRQLHQENLCRESLEEQAPSSRHWDIDYLQDLLDFLDNGRIRWIQKSRDMRVSWACVGYLTRFAMRVPHCGFLFQAQKKDKVIQLVDYAKCLYLRKDDFIKEAFRLLKPIERMDEYSLIFWDGGYIAGIPGVPTRFVVITRGVPQR